MNIEEKIDTAREQYLTWLSDDYMLIPRRFITEKIIRMGHRLTQLYFYIVDEIMSDRCLMDDDGDAYLLVTSEELQTWLNYNCLFNVSVTLGKLRDRKLIEIKRVGNGQMFSPSALKIYLIDPSTGKRIKVLENNFKKSIDE